MKVIILAAGKGSRLGQGILPKPLTALSSGKSILEHQLENLQLYTSLNNVIIVIGYGKDKIMEKFPNLLYVYNPNYAKENTSKSLLKALQKVEEDVLWVNGDVVFHPLVLKKILNDPKTCMVVNIGEVGEEEVKYFQVNGKITEVSKTVVSPQGEALGINYVQQHDIPLLRDQLELCEPEDYFEKGISRCIEKGMNVYCVPIERNLCTEIDFVEDLKRANELLKSWDKDS